MHRSVVDDPAQSVQKSRDDHVLWLGGPSSYLAAIARHELPVGEVLRLEGHVIEALPDGFRVDGVLSGPRTIEAGRYQLRLSHQNMPAVVVLDANAERAAVTPDWFPYDPALRFVLPLVADPAAIAVGSTRERERSATRAGWLEFKVAGVPCRLMALRLNEPGVVPDSLEVYFVDATSGHESYRMRYVELVKDTGGRLVLDFNRAYNPACAYSSFYNCPIPPPENNLKVPIRAGEKTPRGAPHAD